jgi:hypothetical protein
MASKERELLEEISNDKLSWGAADNSLQTLERFQSIAEDLKDTLASLQADDFIGDSDDHTESWSGRHYIDRVYVKSGLTFKGQDKSQWPD